jgi:hypothetical protein
MQFKVPQFLDIEDKIFGPFTFKQFAYLAGGAGFCFVLYRLMGLMYSFIPILIIGGFALALTFYRPNNKPFIYMVEAMFKYALHDKLYIWDRTKNTNPDFTNKPKEVPIVSRNSSSRLTAGKLRDLAWSLDVLDLSKRGNEDEDL